MTRYSPDQNKRIVLEAFETLFNRRDYREAEKFWSPDYIQHSAHIPPAATGCSTSSGRPHPRSATTTPLSLPKTTL